MKKVLAILIVVLVVSCTARLREEERQSGRGLESKIDQIIENHNFNGVVLLTKGTTTIYKKAFGYSDIEEKTALEPDDLFVIGSISKQISAVLILREFEAGNISLEDRVSDFLPNINQTWAAEVTVHHLLTHTHGIVHLEEPLEFEPGTQFHYSQLGYELLAQILEKSTGESFNILSTGLFTNYKLSNTHHPESGNYKNLVKGYEEAENGKLNYASNSLDNYVAAGAFISNAEDLDQWNKLLHSGKLVNQPTLELMKTNYATRVHPVFDTIEYGYGLLFKDGERDVQIGAFGYAPGFVSASYYYPQSNMNLIVLGNAAKDLDDFKKTFEVPTELMELIKKEGAGITALY